jgi:hypothetical protein
MVIQKFFVLQSVVSKKRSKFTQTSFLYTSKPDTSENGKGSARTLIDLLQMNRIYLPLNCSFSTCPRVPPRKTLMQRMLLHERSTYQTQHRNTKPREEHPSQR